VQSLRSAQSCVTGKSPSSGYIRLNVRQITGLDATAKRSSRVNDRDASSGVIVHPRGTWEGKDGDQKRRMQRSMRRRLGRRASMLPCQLWVAQPGKTDQSQSEVAFCSSLPQRFLPQAALTSHRPFRFPKSNKWRREIASIGRYARCSHPLSHSSYNRRLQARPREARLRTSHVRNTQK
jgi:hypothetical protein